MTISFLDLIFPKKCVGCGKFGEYFCEDCFKKIEFVDAPVCPVCQRQAVGGKTHPGCSGHYRLDGLAVACRYQDPVKRAIKQVKYKWVYDIEKVFVDLIAENLWRFNLPDNIDIVPVPLHTRRKNWRGFNQAEILAKTLAQKFNVGYADFLVRQKETKTQVGLSRDERRKNVRGAFAIRGSPPKTEAKQSGVEPLKDYFGVEGKILILVDDVFTSGATMAECAKVLKGAGAKSVWGMAVALG